jgi:hypothetical protein
LSEEGVIQVFYPEIGSQWIVGVVGQLQLDVLISRLEAEYKVEAVLEASPFDTARWVSGTDAALKSFTEFNRGNLAKDRDGNPVYMAKSAWDVGYQQERNPELTDLHLPRLIWIMARVALRSMPEGTRRRVAMFKTNVGGIDRVLRIVVGLVLIALTAMGKLPVWGYVGAVPLLTGLFGTCPIYTLLGANTCPRK